MELNSIINEYSRRGVDIVKLKEGNKLHITTNNNTYVFEITNDIKKIKVQGGYFKKQEYVTICGSTTGTSIFLDWVLLGLHLEIARADGEIIKTSKIKKILIEGKDWSYELTN